MQNRQPMHRSWSTSTVPLSLRKVAPTGQTFRQGAFSHCMQGRGRKTVLPPSSWTSKTLIHSWSPVKCVSWQAFVHSLQPSQRARSMTIAHWGTSPSGVSWFIASSANATLLPPSVTALGGDEDLAEERPTADASVGLRDGVRRSVSFELFVHASNLGPCTVP